MATKVLHLQDLHNRELAALAGDEALISEALALFGKASNNAVLKDVMEKARRESVSLAKDLNELTGDSKHARGNAVKGIIEDGQKRTREMGEHPLVDAELILTAQKLLGFQIAGYKSVLPLTRLLQNSHATLLFETAIEAKRNSVEMLQSTALHQVHWRADWWGKEHTSAWKKVKKLFREDWEKTKEHLGLPSETRQEPEQKSFDLGEPSFRYGYGAALHYKDRTWNEETSNLLRTEYGGMWDETTPKKIEAGWRFARRGHG